MASAKLTAHFLPSGRSLLGRSTVTLQHAFQALQLAHNSFAVGDIFSPPALLPPVMAPQCIEGRLLCFLRLVSVFGNTSSSNRNTEDSIRMFGLVRHLSVLDGPFCNLAGSSCASRYEEEWVLLTIAAASEIIDTDKLSPFLSQTHIPGHPSGATQMVDDRGGVQCKRSVYRWRG